MNYIKQINAFYSRLLLSPLSARGQALWFYLMHCYNTTHWQSPVVVSEATIRGALTLTHKQFLAARKELVDGGYIIHYAKEGRKPASYEVVRLGEDGGI